MSKTAIKYDNLTKTINIICGHKDNILIECNRFINYARNYSNSITNDEFSSIIKEIIILENKLNSNINSINSIVNDTIKGSYTNIENSFSTYFNNLFKQ